MCTRHFWYSLRHNFPFRVLRDVQQEHQEYLYDPLINALEELYTVGESPEQLEMQRWNCWRMYMELVMERSDGYVF